MCEPDGTAPFANVALICGYHGTFIAAVGTNDTYASAGRGGVGTVCGCVAETVTFALVAAVAPIEGG